MIGKLITTVAGRSAAKHIGGNMGGIAGTLVGAGLAMAARSTPIGIALTAAGGIMVWRRYQRQRAAEALETPALPSDPASVVTDPGPQAKVRGKRGG